jgi:hypothetical protein
MIHPAAPKNCAQSRNGNCYMFLRWSRFAAIRFEVQTWSRQKAASKRDLIASSTQNLAKQCSGKLKCLRRQSTD